ncbi:MAG TPA: hypothetical protein VGE01_02375 [Fimbriimonas sp.]
MGPSYAEWSIQEAEDLRPLAILWRNVRSVPWYAFPVFGGALVSAVLLSSLGVFVGFFSFGGYLLLRRFPADRVLRLAQHPSPVEQFPVEISLDRAGVPYGEDSGFITFVNGWLVYEGLHTSFSVRSKDVREFDSRNPDRKTFDSLAHWLGWVEQDEWHILGIRPLPVSMDLEGRRIGQRDRVFTERLINWKTGPERPKGQPVLPPLRPHPSGYYRAWIRRWWSWLCLAAAFACIGFIPFLAAYQTATFLIVAAAALFGAAVLLERSFRSRRNALDRMEVAYTRRFPSRNDPLPLARKLGSTL